MADESTWVDSLPEPIREWDEVKNSDSPDKFWDQMSNMRSHLGTSIRIPSENASPEDVQAFHEKLTSKVPGLMPTPDVNDKTSLDALYNLTGRPKTAEEYKVPGETPVTEQMKAFMSAAHELGLSQAQFEGVVGQASAANASVSEAALEAHKVDTDSLKTEWGETHVERMSAAKSIAEKTGAPKELLEAFEKGTLDSRTAKWLYNLSQAITPEGTNLTTDKSESPKMTPEEAQMQISEVLNNPKHPYWNSTDPGHQAALKAYDKLYEYAYPEDKNQTVSFSGAAVGIGGVYGN
jgi:hypothetical protein